MVADDRAAFDNRIAVQSHAGIGIDLFGGGMVRNSIVMHNAANNVPANFGHSATGWAIRTSCLSPLPDGNVLDSIDADPLLYDLVSGDLRLMAGSPCINRGTNLPWMAGATDYAGNDRIVDGRVDIGSDEVSALACNPVAGAPVGFTPHPVVFTGYVAGAHTSGLRYWWDFDGDGTYDLSGPNLRVVSNTYLSGVYTVTLHVSNSMGETATLVKPDYIVVGPEFTYVARDGAHVTPFDSWARAATSVPPAIAAGIQGTTVLLSNGVFRFGEAVVVTNHVTVRGAFGASASVIDGNRAHRCLAVNHPQAVVAEVTLANGKVSSPPYGAGVYIEFGTVRDCVIVSNDRVGAWVESGGALRHSVVRHNEAFTGAGVYIKQGTVDRCTIVENTAALKAAGVFMYYGGTLRSSLVLSNTAAIEAGGVYADHDGYIENCTVCGNDARDEAGGVYLYFGGWLRNSIVYDNSATNYPNIRDRGSDYLGYVCTPDSVSGFNILSNRPQFVNAALGDYALQAGSPCINTGIYFAWMATGQDLPGHARKMGAKVDLGAYEFPEPTLYAAPAVVAFDEVEPGLNATGILSLANVGVGVVTAQLSSVNAPFECLSPLTHYLGATVSADVTYVFSPAGEGWFTTNVYITGANGAEVELRGHAIPEALGGLAVVVLAALVCRRTQ